MHALQTLRNARSTRLVALLVAAALCGACVSTDLASIASLGADYEPTADERGLWAESRAEEEALLDEAWIYDDPALGDYLDDLVAELSSPGMTANPELDLRVLVLDDPTLNAFAFPHGTLVVHTGILARMETEAQLATVLAHEITHVERRHMLRFRRAAHNRQIAVSAVAVAAAVVLAHERRDAWRSRDWDREAAIGILGDLFIHLGLQLAILAAVNGYGRDLELEADHGAFDRLERAGYDLAQAPRVYELLQEGHDPDSDLEVFFFGDHPQLAARAEAARERVALQADAASEEAARAGDAIVRERTSIRRDRFLRHIVPVVFDDVAHNLDLGRLEIASGQLERLRALDPESPSVHLLAADLHLATAEAASDPDEALRERAAAHDALREAVRLDPEHPLPHRRLGVLLWEDGALDAACSELRLYLELAPTAPDAPTYRGYLEELEEAEAC